MKVLAYIGLVLLSILFVLSTLVGGLVWSVNATVLKPYQSIEYLKESGVYANLGTFIGDMITGEGNEQQNNNQDTNNTNENENDSLVEEAQLELETTMKTALKNSLSESYVETKFSELQTNIWDYLTNKSELSLVISIPEIQENILKAVLENSKIPEEMKAEAKNKIGEMIPASIDFLALLEKGNENNQNGEQGNQIDIPQIKEIYGTIKLLSLAAYGAVLLLLIFCVLLTLYLKNIRGWIGTIMLIPGILILLLGIGIHLAVGYIPTPDLPEGLVPAFANLVSLVSSDLSSQLILIGSILIVFSLLLFLSKWIFSLFRKKTTA